MDLKIGLKAPAQNPPHKLNLAIKFNRSAVQSEDLDLTPLKNIQSSGTSGLLNAEVS